MDIQLARTLHMWSWLEPMPCLPSGLHSSVHLSATAPSVAATTFTATATHTAGRAAARTSTLHAQRRLDRCDVGTIV